MWVTTTDGLVCPEALSVQDATEVDAKTDRKRVLAALKRGEHVLVADLYSTGLAVLADLKKELSASHGADSFEGSRRLRSAYHETSSRLLVRIRDQAMALRKAPTIGWLERLYSDVGEFCLPFPQVQGLNSSWQWYTKGIQVPVLDHRIHPFYGTYFPTRFEHLELFDDWLTSYDGSLESTVDIGTGCGVLSFQLLRHRAGGVWATDTNPNAIMSVREDLERIEQRSRVHPAQGDLFAGFENQADLIVLNPPWLPGEAPGLIDTAIYYPPEFFERFFEAAAERLSDEGRLVVLFSSLGSQAYPDVRHPIEAELAGGGRFHEVSRLRRSVAMASKKTKRQKHTRRNEHVELWELRR
jgi:hypothetical protein